MDNNSALVQGDFAELCDTEEENMKMGVVNLSPNCVDSIYTFVVVLSAMGIMLKALVNLHNDH